MNLFELGRTYWNSLHEGNRTDQPQADKTMSLAVADFWALREEFDREEYENAKGEPYPYDFHHQITICVSTSQLRYLVGNMPNAFADIPPLTHEEAMSRPEDEVKTYLDMLSDDPTSDSWQARFGSWLKAKRPEKR
jgi:hypothetical protein